MKNRKIRPGHKIVQVLLSAGRVTDDYEEGKYKDVVKEQRPCRPVPVAEIAAMFIADPKIGPGQLYKLSGYVGDIRKYDQGVIRVQKEGREVITYQLMNPWLFNDHGQNIEITTKLLEPKVKSVPVEPTVSEPVEATVANEEVVVDNVLSDEDVSEVMDVAA